MNALNRMPLFFLAVAAVFSLPVVSAEEGEKNTVFIIRGGGGYFPKLDTVINDKFEARGLEVVTYRFHERFEAAKKLKAAYEAGELPHGIILVGYSLGGCGAIRVSKILQKDDIPVKLLFLIETVNPLQKVPGNVEECFNLYHFPALLGHAVKAESEKTKLTNCEAYTDAGFGLEYSHFVLPFVDEVHELIAKELVGAIQEEPLGDDAPNRLRMNP